MNTNQKASRPRWRHPLVLLAALVVVAGLAVGGYGIWYLFLQGPGPAGVGNGASLAPIPSSVANGGATNFDGTWSVDTKVGSFSDFSGSFVGYRVREQLSGIGANTAVGRTPNVSGTITVSGLKVTAAEITADLTTLKSDDDRRDGQLNRQGIQTGTFPTATFKLTEPITGTAIPADGTVVDVVAKGQLTLHGVTKDVSIPLKAQHSGSVIEIAGSIELTFADYDITPPSSFAVLSVEDTGTLELQLFFTRS